MFKGIRNGIGRLGAYGRGIFERALVEPDINSRLVFMGTFLVTSLLMLVHTVIYAVAFLTHGKTDPSYPTILGVLAGGHGVNGIARFFTKKNGGDGGGNGNGQQPAQDPPPQQPAQDSPPQQ
jgi:hypothetical protein